MRSYVFAAATVVALAGATGIALAQPPAGRGQGRGPGPGMTPVATATADIKGEGIAGTATLTEVRHGNGSAVHVEITVTGLKPGLHGVHLHAVGKCEPPFLSAGGHFDPGPAGNTDPDANHPFHMGDLPNLVADDNGKGTLSGVTTRVTLTDSLVTAFDADGTAIIIHANPDQGITGEPKSGVSGGPRVACGILTKKQ
jgi:superoxide dismutase, Cu-Zn family